MTPTQVKRRVDALREAQEREKDERAGIVLGAVPSSARAAVD